MNFWDSEVWGSFLVIITLLVSLLAGNTVRRKVKFLRNSLIPTSVLGGTILILVAGIYKLFTGDIMFDAPIFGENGTAMLETLTYHCLALGFIASTFRPTKGKLNKQRTTEIFNTGVTTVSTYLLQAVVGFGITMIAALILKDFFAAAGILLPFGYGQGTGQAMNYGAIYENDFGFTDGKSFGLTIAALGFICASVGGVIHLNILRKRGHIEKRAQAAENVIHYADIQNSDEIPMQESIDKMTVQIALIGLAYLLSYIMMCLLGRLLPGMKSVIFGFNFLLGVLSATLVKGVMGFLKKKKIMKREYTNDFLMTRASNFFYDLMVVAGIAAIRLSSIERYWGIMLILGLAGMIVTYAYNRIVAKTLFKDYSEEQFLAMYGMLTGTASTGVILLREIDGDFQTPAADNLVYQNFPAIVFGFPIMLLVTIAPIHPYLTMGVLAAFFAVMNLILFRSKIFKRKKSKVSS